MTQSKPRKSFLVEAWLLKSEQKVKHGDAKTYSNLRPSHCAAGKKNKVEISLFYLMLSAPLDLVPGLRPVPWHLEQWTLGIVGGR